MGSGAVFQGMEPGHSGAHARAMLLAGACHGGDWRWRARVQQAWQGGSGSPASRGCRRRGPGHSRLALACPTCLVSLALSCVCSTLCLLPLSAVHCWCYIGSSIQLAWGFGGCRCCPVSQWQLQRACLACEEEGSRGRACGLFGLIPRDALRGSIRGHVRYQGGHRIQEERGAEGEKGDRASSGGKQQANQTRKGGTDA